MSKPSLSCTAKCPVSQQQYIITHNSTIRKMLTSQQSGPAGGVAKENYKSPTYKTL
jgi:hypothetical protein